jgi:DNA-binding GntR family transcriptional regulator
MSATEYLGRRSQRTLVDEIVEAIRERILRGELEPGLKIRQQEFAAQLGVSRTPLREAFQRLEADGWVQLRARRGAEVRALTVAEAEEIFTMRVVLETTAARLAAVAHTAMDADRARALLGQDRWESEDAPDEIDDLNRALHSQIYALDSPAMPRELVTLLRGYWARALRYRLVYWGRPASIALSRAAHGAILEAWLQRDADATERAVADHILTALWEITARIDVGSEPSPALRALAERYRVEIPTRSPTEAR